MVSEISHTENSSLPRGSNLLANNRTAEVDIEKYLYLILSKWYIIFLSLAIGYFLASLYLRYTLPVYSASTKLLIKDTKSSTGMSETAIFNDLGLLNSSRNLQNEIQILKTRYLMQQVVKGLNLQYNYSKVGRLKRTDLYGESPVVVQSWIPIDSTIRRNYQIIINLIGSNQYELQVEEKFFKGQLGNEINIGVGKIVLIEGNQNDKKVNTSKTTILLTIYNTLNIAEKYSRQLTVGLDAKNISAVLDLSFKDENLARAMDILNRLIEEYNRSEVDDKNRIYEYTLKFINDRLLYLVDELKVVENNVATYKSRTNSLDLAGEGTMLLAESASNNRELVQLNAQLRIIGDIRSQLIKESTKFEFVPTGSLIDLPSLNNLLETFNTFLLEREKSINELGSKHPNINLIEKQLNNIRLRIIENVNSIETELVSKRSVIINQEKTVTGRIKVLPDNEKQLFEIQRQQIIKQGLYLYLLQKREETALSLNVTVANNRIIEPVRSNGQIAPIVRRVKLMGLTLGFILPIFFILLLDVMNKKVMTEENIRDKTLTPIIGIIPFSSNREHIVIGDNKRSATAEMFRLMRANFQFIGEGVNNKIIAVTSSISGEGKSFITLNLGLTLAIAGKRILIMELDMRKPKLAGYLGHVKGTGKGITEYLVDDKISRNEIIYTSKINANLYYLPCGTIPPNPSELLLSKKFEDLINIIKKDFDFIFMDTPPIGLVSDALLLSKCIDSTFYIVRQNMSEKRQLKIIEDIRILNKMPRVYIVFNGVKQGASGYGENYGYGYGYYGEEKKAKTFLSIIKSKFFRNNLVE